MPFVAVITRETFFFHRRANFDSKFAPGSAEEQRRKRESALCLFTAFDILAIADARADVLGAMIRDGGCEAMVDIKGGAGGVIAFPERDVGGGFAFAVECKISKIDDAGFLVLPSRL
jgi:hypothetical protein